MIIPNGEDYYATIQLISKIFKNLRYTNIEKFADEEIEKLVCFIETMTESGEAISDGELFLRIKPPITHFTIYYYILSGHEFSDKLIEGPDEGKCILQTFKLPKGENRKDALVIEKEYFQSFDKYHIIEYEPFNGKPFRKIKSHINFPINSGKGKNFANAIRTMLKKMYGELLSSYAESY